MSSNDETRDTRDLSDIESDLADNRRRIGATLDQLGDEFTPGRMVDHALGFARRRRDDGTAADAQALVVRNPLPVLLIGAGIAWLALSGRDGSTPAPRASASETDPRAPATGAEASTSPAAAAPVEAGSPFPSAESRGTARAEPAAKTASPSDSD